jgi:hypothetical protein
MSEKQVDEEYSMRARIWYKFEVERHERILSQLLPLSLSPLCNHNHFFRLQQKGKMTP